MERKKFIDLAVKREKQKNKENWRDRGNDLFKEANNKRCLVYYQRPNWVTADFAEAIEYLLTLTDEEWFSLEKVVDKTYRILMSEQHKKQREARQKREANKAEEGEKWKALLKPGDIILVKQMGINRAMLVMEMDEYDITGRYLDQAWDNINGGYIKNTFTKTPYMAEKMYKFVVKKLDNAIIQK